MTIISKRLFLVILGISVCLATSNSTVISEKSSSLENLGNNTADCNSFIKYMRDKAQSKPVLYNETFERDAKILSQYSGHSLNDLGMYHTCIKLQPSHYLLMEITTTNGINVPDGSFGLYAGLCLPKYCEKEHLENETAQVENWIQLYDIKELEGGEILYIEPSYTIYQGFWLYFTIALLVILVLLSVIGTNLSPLAQGERATWESLIITTVEPAEPVEPTEAPLLNNNINGADSFKDSVTSQDQVPVTLRTRSSKAGKLARYLQARPTLSKFLECFNFQMNVKSLFRREYESKMDHHLTALDGLRTIAFFGVVFGHVFLSSAISKNQASVSQFTKDPGFLIAVAAFFGVDIFFILSGFFQGFQLTGKLRRSRFTPEVYYKLIRHRWLRIAPVYFIAILVYWKLSVYFGDGPVWYQYVDRAQQCGTTWWKNILFLDNVLNTSSKDYCFNWGWFLACDFQMFLIAPFICWIFVRNKTRAHNILWLLGLFAFIAGFWEVANVDYKYSNPPTPTKGNFFSAFYSNTLVRMSTYLIGLLLGTQYRDYKQGDEDNLFARIKQNQTLGYFISLIGVSLVAFVIFYPRSVQLGHNWEDGFNYMWQVIDRPMLAGGMFLMVLPTIVGLLQPIKYLLGSYFFIIISKISYSGYLIQLILILALAKGQTAFSGFGYKYKARMTISIMLISLLFGALLYIFVEKPITNLEAAFLGHPEKIERKRRETEERNQGKIVKKSMLKKSAIVN